MKLFILVIVLSLVLIPVFVLLVQNIVNEDLPQQDNIKEDTEYDIRDSWFFPKEKARWDGSKTTVGEWRSLSKVQKLAFITEYIEEFGRSLFITIQEIDILGYMISLDNSAEDCEGECLKKPMTSFIEELLEDDGIIKDTVVVE